MTPTLPHELLSAVSGLVERRMGIHIPPGRLVDLERGLRSAARETGAADVGRFAHQLLGTPLSQETEDLLAAHLTIGETYFYRDPRAFEVFEKEVVPELLRHHAGNARTLRIWSAACCTGEEPYSIAMALRKVLGEDRTWKISILGTDLNPRFLKKAADGIYGPWSFRTLPAEMRERYFHKHAADRWRIDDDIKACVRFAGLNFVDDAFPSAANDTQAHDVIFCRNVLMYFSRETAAKIIAKLRRCLVPGGWLFTSATDAPRELFAGFTIHEAEGTIIYRRTEDEAPMADASSGGLVVCGAGDQRVTGRTVMAAAVAPKAASGVHAARTGKTGAVPAGNAGSLLAEFSCELRNRARELADKGRFEEALAAIDRAIERNKLDATAHYLRGVILHEQGREGEAASSLHRALYLEPGFVLAHVTLGNIMRRGGKENAARRSFANALDLLGRLDRDAVLPESGGMTAGRLLQILSGPKSAIA